MNKQDIAIRRGSENVFADLGFIDADMHMVKAQLAVIIDEVMSEKNLTQVQAAQAMGTGKLDVSRLLKGQFRDVSIEQIMRMLTRLGCEVDIVIRSPGRKRAGTIIHIQSAAG